MKNELEIIDELVKDGAKFWIRSSSKRYASKDMAYGAQIYINKKWYEAYGANVQEAIEKLVEVLP